MEHAGVRGVYRLPAVQSQPPGQVDVLQVHEEVLVESAKFDEKVTSDHTSSATGTKYFTRIIGPCGRLSVESLVRATSTKVAVASAVDKR